MFYNSAKRGELRNLYKEFRLNFPAYKAKAHKDVLLMAMDFIETIEDAKDESIGNLDLASFIEELVYTFKDISIRQYTKITNEIYKYQEWLYEKYDTDIAGLHIPSVISQYILQTKESVFRGLTPVSEERLLKLLNACGFIRRVSGVLMHEEIARAVILLTYYTGLNLQTIFFINKADIKIEGVSVYIDKLDVVIKSQELALVLNRILKADMVGVKRGNYIETAHYTTSYITPFIHKGFIYSLYQTRLNVLRDMLDEVENIYPINVRHMQHHKSIKEKIFTLPKLPTDNVKHFSKLIKHNPLWQCKYNNQSEIYELYFYHKLWVEDKL